MIEKPRFVPAIKNWLRCAPYMPPPEQQETEKPIYEPNNCPDMTYWWRKFVLRRIDTEALDETPELAKFVNKLWFQRGEWGKDRAMDLLSRIDGVQNLTRYEPYTKEDYAGNDLNFKINGILMHVEAKTSRYGIVEFKQSIRDQYFPGNPNSPELVQKWMTERRIILVNFSETRSDDNIINTSILPQMNRILAAEEAKAA